MRHGARGVLLLLLLALHHRLPAVQALPPGFEDESVVHMNQVVDLDFASGNMMLAVTKDGKLYRFDVSDDNADRELVWDLSDRVCSNGERGLGTVVVHPNFAETRWIYLFYTYNLGDPSCLVDDINNGPVNRCVRVRLNEDWSVDRDSELILFQTTRLDNRIHNGGAMAFGVDGMLYVTTGDAGERTREFSQRRNNLHGSVLRLTDSGEIPVDNPYTGDGTARCNEEGETDSDLICQEVFAVGLRNPFRFTMDPHSSDKVRFLIADVGAETWEELNVGGADYVGANYGWPYLEGPCEWHDRDECPIGDPNAEYDNPFYWYQHDSEEEGCALGIAIPPPNLAWPAPYNDPNSFFLAEYVWGEIYHITEDPSEYCDTCTPPRHGYSTEIFHQYDRPIGLKFGPYIDHSGGSGASTALYYTYREGTIDIRRIVYKGGDNFAPVVTFTADRSNVNLGGTIQFDASDTFDPNHAIDELDFFWSFGDDSPQASGVVVEHQYEAIGVYTVTLTAYDPEGAINSYTMEVSVGAMPTVEILSPAEGTTFAVGDVFLLVGEGTDAYGNILVDSDFTWEVRQHHKNHFHPYLPEDTVGNTIAIDPAPEPEDSFAAGNSHLEVLLTGTDSLGISATVSRIVMPKTLEVGFDTIPTGLTLQIDEQQLTMPQRILTWENHNLHVFAPDQGEYTFSSWAAGVAQNQTDTINVPRGSSTSGENLTFVAVFEPTAAEVTPEVTAPPTETNTTNDVCTPERSRCGEFFPECCAGTLCGVGDRGTCTACSLEGVTCGPNRRVCCSGLICNVDARECQPLVVATLPPTGQPTAAPVVATLSPTVSTTTQSPTAAAAFNADADISSATEDDVAADNGLSSEAGPKDNIVLNQSGSASMTVWRLWIGWNMIPFLLLPVLGYF